MKKKRPIVGFNSLNQGIIPVSQRNALLEKSTECTSTQKSKICSSIHPSIQSMFFVPFPCPCNYILINAIHLCPLDKRHSSLSGNVPFNFLLIALLTEFHEPPYPPPPMHCLLLFIFII